MKIVGITLDGILKEVKISDCPSVIDKGQVACLAVENSDIYYQDSLCYYDEEHDIMEGDIVLSNGKEIGITYYEAGWKIHDLEGQYKELHLTGYISMKRSKRNYEVLSKLNNTFSRKLLIYADGKEGGLLDMAMIQGDEIALIGRNKRVYRTEVYLSTGRYTKNNGCLYFGQFLLGGTLSLNNELDFVIRSGSKETIIKMEDL